MVITKHILIEKYGIDKKIATFFADRNPPPDNLFWKNSSVYIRNAGTGHLLIPFFFDCFYKCGFSIDDILQEDVIQGVEKVFDLIIKNEAGVLSNNDFVQQSLSFFPIIKNAKLHADFIVYLKGDFAKAGLFGTGYFSLNRADVLLIVLCCYEATTEQVELFLTQWYNFNSCMLMLDDSADMDKDREKKELNIFLEVGDNEAGSVFAKNLYSQYTDGIAGINSKLSDFFKKSGSFIT